MNKPRIVIIAAMAAKNRVIGNKNKLPWHIPADLKRFRKLTVGHPVLMGRKTFQSIIARNGQPLPQRKNIVLSSNPTLFQHPDVAVYATLDEALANLKTALKVSIIGGETVYRATLPIADELELTLVEGAYFGDAFFPDFSDPPHSGFTLEAREDFDGYSFVSYRRV